MSLVPIIVHTQARASLALIKYWGKADDSLNTPDTGSLAVTLDSLVTDTELKENKLEDQVVVSGKLQPIARYESFFDYAKKTLNLQGRFFQISSYNNFPSSAGLASSSSGFCALAGALEGFSRYTQKANQPPDPFLISHLARLGSGSASRSVWGGFTLFPAGAKEAQEEASESFWPDFRIIIALVTEEQKPISSREGMNRSKTTSPYYRTWVESSKKLLEDSQKALQSKNIKLLGPLIRQSYLRMFATMFTSEPPFIYWKETSLSLIKELENIRNQGYDIWETMDAGPQVKMFCLEKDIDYLLNYLKIHFPQVTFITAKPGAGLQTFFKEDI